MATRTAWSFVCAMLLAYFDSTRFAASTMVPDFAQLCPYSNFCTRSAALQIHNPEMTSCCLPCSCHADCGIVNKCCPDAGNVSPPAKVYPCRRQDEIYRSYLNLAEYRTSNNLFYRIIDGCPAEAFSTPGLAENVSRCYNASDIDDLVFVTGSVSGHTYLNKHCAACNNDMLHTDWTLHIVDASLLANVTSFEDRDGRILKNGGIISVPPTRDIALGSLCSPYAIRECNVTRTWDSYDMNLEKKCHDKSQEYLAEGNGPFIGRYDFYANVYCFLCNNPRGTQMPSRCENIKTNPINGSKGGFGPKFSALLSDEQHIHQKTECKIGEVLDHFRMKCTPLLCPVGTAARGGDCIRFVDNIVGYTIAVAIEVEQVGDSGQNKSGINLNTFAREIRDFVLQTLNRSSIICTFCNLYVHLHRVTGTIYITTYLSSTHACTETDLLRGISNLFNLNLYLPKTQLAISLKNIAFPTIMNGIDSGLIDSPEKIVQLQCFQNVDYYTTDMIYCPSIYLNPDELREYRNMYTRNTVDMILSKATEIRNGTIQICLEEYVLIMERTGSAARKVFQTGKMMIMMVLYLISTQLYKGFL